MRREYDILFRYISLFIFIFFFISTYFVLPITNIFLSISYWFLQLITTVELVAGELLVNSTYKFLIIEACISPSAYMFISFIFLALPIRFMRNISLLIRALLLFTFINLIRILFLMWVHVTFGVDTFEQFHYIFYEGISGILTAIIIIFYLRKDHIKKTYPLYTDIKSLLKDIRKGFNK